ncbi:MAG: YidC/Oxa1 family membrane protein insertase [Anaerolineae bacterium]|nr:YidC/Oxa1 family membrane protein insertase [Anaerolineae bacterium]
MWDFIINPMTTLLILMYKLMGNNVVLAIVVLTVVLRMMMYPLFAKQQNSAKKMQDVQPRLEKLKEKYKDDKEKMAQVQMELYKEAGINPVGGCLPMVVQFPIFISLYQAIFFALAATPFQLVDLSERLMIPSLANLIPLQNMWLGMSLTESPAPPNNPTYALLLPALVMVTTYIQFKYSSAQTSAAKAPASGEDKPNQAQAMTQSMGTIMPIMFGFIALSMSVGLSLYFIASNLVGIAQYSPALKPTLDRIFGQTDESEKADDDSKIEDDKQDKSRKKGMST